LRKLGSVLQSTGAAEDSLDNVSFRKKKWQPGTRRKFENQG